MPNELNVEMKKETIAKILNKLNKEIFLPGIQRKYVWKDEQIVKFMDSIMRGYPLGTFLFWSLKKQTINQNDSKIYKFINHYHQRDSYLNEQNGKFSTNLQEKISLILDGQQRLTSLYIALTGSLSRKLPNKRKVNNSSYPEKELYFNLNSAKENNEYDDDIILYEFQFLTKEEIDKSDNKLWYKVKDIFNYEELSDLNIKLINKNNWNANENVMKNVTKLFNKLVVDKIINYYEIESNNINDVLDIFVRVNSGGTILSKTDLLFSTVVARWEDAREEIDGLVKEINNIGEKYKFSNDFIMRTCLYLLDQPIALQVDTLKNSANIIEQKWNAISESIKKTIELFKELGFCDENITSYNAIIPIIYYVYKSGDIKNLENKKNIKKYFVLSQIKRIFGTSSNVALNQTRNVLKYNTNTNFPIKKLEEIRFTGNRDLSCTEEQIVEFVENEEKNEYTFLLLSLLYDNFKYGQESFHQDHMHAYSAFKDKNIKKLVPNIGKNKIEEWQEKRNKLPNLQILEGTENREKRAENLNEWLSRYGNKNNIKYLKSNDKDYCDLSNFDKFYDDRKEIMIEELKKILL